MDFAWDSEAQAWRDGLRTTLGSVASPLNLVSASESGESALKARTAIEDALDVADIVTDAGLSSSLRDELVWLTLFEFARAGMGSSLRSVYLPALALGKAFGLDRAEVQANLDLTAVAVVPWNSRSVSRGGVKTSLAHAMTSQPAALLDCRRNHSGAELVLVDDVVGALQAVTGRDGDLAFVVDHQVLSTKPAKTLGRLADDEFGYGAGLVACDRLWRSAALAGLCSGLVGLTVDYVQMRYQFGKPIGVFQAVRHGCARMEIAARSAELTSLDALGRSGESTERQRLWSAVAAQVSIEAAQLCANSAAQFHAGVGHIVEHHLPVYYKKALAWLGESDRCADLEKEIGRIVAPQIDHGWETWFASARGEQAGWS